MDVSYFDWLAGSLEPFEHEPPPPPDSYLADGIAAAESLDELERGPI